MSRSLVSLVFLLILSLILAPVGADVQVQLYSGSGTAGANSNQINAESFTTSSPITLTQLGYNFLSQPNFGSAFVLGVYSDSGNYPGNILGQTSEISPSATGWVFANLQSSVNLATNTQYWLVMEENGVGIAGLGYAGTGTGSMRYRTFTYSSTMPGTFPAGAGGTPAVFWNLGYAYSIGSFTANHASFSASPSGSTVQASLGYTNTLTENVIIVFSIKDSSMVLQDSPKGTATSGVSGGTASATSKSLSLGTYTVSWQAYRASDTTFSNPIDSSTPSEQKTVTTAPPPNDFIITALTTTQTVGAGVTATYSLNIQYGSGLTATVNLAVTSGCPTGVSCTFSPTSVTGTQTVTLSVPTLITTPGGTTSLTVTASSTSPVLSHTVTVQLTVTAPSSSPISVHAGASQVVVTVSWAGTGTAPVTLAGPGASPTLTESGAAVYDRTSIPTGSSTPTYIHRVTFTLSPPPASTQTWTVLISISVPSGYTVTIEVS